jgi:hypothetical protein
LHSSHCLYLADPSLFHSRHKRATRERANFRLAPKNPSSKKKPPPLIVDHEHAKTPFSAETSQKSITGEREPLVLDRYA